METNAATEFKLKRKGILHELNCDENEKQSIWLNASKRSLSKSEENETMENQCVW